MTEELLLDCLSVLGVQEASIAGQKDFSPSSACLLLPVSPPIILFLFLFLSLCPHLSPILLACRARTGRFPHPLSRGIMAILFLQGKVLQNGIA